MEHIDLLTLTALVVLASFIGVAHAAIKTTDEDSRKSFDPALITLGNAWDRNHHRYLDAVGQGFCWWEIVLTYGLLKTFSWTGLIRELKPVPVSIYEKGARRLKKLVHFYRIR